MYVQIRNLKFKYRNAKELTIKDFSVDIEDGEIVSILGESGSGKSTMLRLLSGLEAPESGMIKIRNDVMADKNHFVMPEKRGVGMVFQDYALFPHMMVRDNIKFGLIKMSGKEKDQRVEEVLKLVDMIDYGKRYPHELSGGQQQRIALARALAPKPSVLLLDEPFSNLDSHLQESIRTELKRIIKKAGITSIFVTHDKKDALEIADRVIVLKEGEIIEDGVPRDVLKIA